MTPPDPAPRPSRRYMSSTGQVVIPILLVVLLIFVIGRQILDAGFEEEEPPAPVPTSPGTGTEEEKESSGPSRLATDYPGSCLQDASSDGSGLIAAASGNSIGVGTPEGQAAFALRAAAPVGFSASGDYLATAGADLWSRTGAHIGLAFGRPVVTWAWSPAGDCLAGIERGRLMFVRPDKAPKVLVRGVPVSDFSFSPDGSRLIFAVADASDSSGIWMAELGSGKVKLLLDEIGWEVTGWSRAMRPILLQEPGDSRSRDGLSFRSADEVAYCGAEIVTIQKGRLASFGVSGAPTFLEGDRGSRYAGVACAPGQDLLAGVRFADGDPSATTLVVMRTDGTLVEELSTDGALEDYPMWGPPRTGVIFAGDAGGGSDDPLVWFVPEAGEPRPTGLRVDRLGDRIDTLLDWSATPPVGHPTR